MYEPLQAAREKKKVESILTIYGCFWGNSPHQNALWRWKTQENLSSDCPPDHCDYSGYMQSTQPSTLPILIQPPTSITVCNSCKITDKQNRAKLCLMLILMSYKGCFYNSHFSQNCSFIKVRLMVFVQLLAYRVSVHACVAVCDVNMDFAPVQDWEIC